MKTTRIHTIARLAVAVALVLVAAGCASSGPWVTEEPKFIQLHHVANTGEDLNLKKRDVIGMVCTKCKTVLYANVDKPRTRFFIPLEHRHYCAGCKSTITTTGAGFNSKEQVEHTCDASAVASPCFAAPPSRASVLPKAWRKNSVLSSPQHRAMNNELNV